jgi:hypothetical protein
MEPKRSPVDCHSRKDSSSKNNRTTPEAYEGVIFAPTMPNSGSPSSTDVTIFGSLHLERMYPKIWHTPKYDSLPSEEDVHEKYRTLPLSPLPRHSARGLNFYIILPWVICAILFTFLVITQTIHQSHRAHDTYETGFDTEFSIDPVPTDHVFLKQSLTTF